MAEDSSADKTEDPTARKLRNARDEGQVARSVELPAAAVTIGAILVMFFMGGYWIKQMAEICEPLLDGGFKKINLDKLTTIVEGLHTSKYNQKDI